MTDVQIAVIGCGAIADQYYFPALASDPVLRAATWLVDPSERRRSDVIRKFGFGASRQFAEASEIPDSVGLAINATPSHLHVDTTLPLINRQINVLVEKPFAEFSQQALSLVEAAKERCLLSVNQYRRLVPSYALVNEIIRNGDIGEVRRITWSEGHKFDWPTQSGFYFRRPWGSGRPRGALLDIGVHILDQICWWTRETPVPVSVVMDGYGGPEAFVSANMVGANMEIELAISFHGTLSNTYVVEGTKGRVRGSTIDHSRIAKQSGSGAWRDIATSGGSAWPSLAKRLVKNVTDAIQGQDRLLVPAAEVIPALIAIDSLYETAGELCPDSYREWKQ